MKEELLHYVWKTKSFLFTDLLTTEDQHLEIQNYGFYNLNSGPDFLEGKVLIDGTIWAGHIEMHTFSSDWIKHNHQIDEAYNNVVLHVVWKEDETDLDGAKRELLEESGYDVSDDKRWIYLGEITTSKLTNEKHPCFAVNINNIEQDEIIGDGSINEQKSKFELIHPEKIFDLQDTFLNTTLLKLLQKLGAF